MCKKYERIPEKFFTHTRHIAEFWNTVSNIPFIIIALLRLCEGDLVPQVSVLYKLMAMCGVCSAVHHANTERWTIVIDWIPIFLSVLFIFLAELYVYISFSVWFSVFLSLGVLGADHVYRLVPVPWGHVMWHLVASLTADLAYQSMNGSLKNF